MIIQSLLRTGHAEFDGRYYQVRDCELLPRGPRASGPPIIIGTVGERGMRLAARHADGWNTVWFRFDNSPVGVTRMRSVVDAACEAEGRDPATLSRSLGVLVEVPDAPPVPRGQPAWYPGPNGHVLSSEPAELAETFRSFAREGIDHLQVWVNPCTPAGVEALGPALELLDQTELVSR